MGMLTQRDVLREIAQTTEGARGRQTAPAPVRRLVGAIEIEARVEPGSRAELCTVSELPLPEASVVTAIHRRGEVVIPRGGVRLETNDLAVVLSVPPEEGAVRELFANPQAQSRNNWWFLPHAPQAPSDDAEPR